MKARISVQQRGHGVGVLDAQEDDRPQLLAVELERPTDVVRTEVAGDSARGSTSKPRTGGEHDGRPADIDHVVVIVGRVAGHSGPVSPTLTRDVLVGQPELVDDRAARSGVEGQRAMAYVLTTVPAGSVLFNHEPSSASSTTCCRHTATGAP